MSLYGERLLPLLTHGVCSCRRFAAQRGLLVPQAQGVVLEIGAGSGLNLPFYDPQRVERLFALEPAAAARRLAEKRIAATPLAVEQLAAGAEAIPLPAASIDTAVVTFTLCTLPALDAALAELRRVLRPQGRLLFCEHGLAPDPAVQRWQRRLDPLWSRLAGGCHLDRPIPQLLERAGFGLRDLDTGYLAAWRAGSYIYRGSADRR